ncbi:hypothetical protein BJ170DRAFT_698863 [Xylariales sp. AK1849]|nr:hypothetical protein BJ170DRAFT_698863 [Xylariales sp. AK1849]
MTDASLPPGFVSFTKKWYSEPYPFISSMRPELSARGKNIVITGGGTGIGQATGAAFARAGARSISILGRRADKLKSSAASILAAAFEETTVSYETADLADWAQTAAAFDSIAQKVGKIDVLISNAGMYGDKGPMATFSAETFMRVFQANVITALHAFQAFLPHAGPEPVLLNTSTGMAHIAPWVDSGAYPTGKAAALKMTDFIAAENPNVRVISVHPGWIPTDFNAHQQEAPDSIKLPASFFVWLTSPEAAFLKSKYVWANWDAQELLERAEEIRGSRLLTWGLDGVPM